MSRNLQKYARQTNVRLILGFVLLLFIVGDGLIYLFFGRGAAIMGLICLLGSLSPILMILVALWIIDWVGKKNSRD